MQWSKLKSTLESFLCEKLQNRIHIHATVYRKSHDQPAKVWLTFDKKEIVFANDLTYAMKHEELYQKIKEEQQLGSIPFSTDWKEMYYSEERNKLVDASDTAEAILINNSIFSSYYIYQSFISYGSLSIEDALISKNSIIQAYAMFDRRLGKRRLKKMQFSKDTHPIIIQFYKIRCLVEGMENKIATD